MVEENIVKGTVNSVSSGDFLGLDVRSIVGDALLSLSEELGIDMQVIMNKILTSLSISSFMFFSMNDFYVERNCYG